MGNETRAITGTATAHQRLADAQRPGALPAQPFIEPKVSDVEKSGEAREIRERDQGSERGNGERSYLLTVTPRRPSASVPAPSPHIACLVGRDNDSVVVRRSDWELCKPMESARRPPYERRFSASETEAVLRGLKPSEMEDRWFIFAEDDVVHFHRSWIGDEIFALRLRRFPDGGAEVDELSVTAEFAELSGNYGQVHWTWTVVLDALLDLLSGKAPAKTESQG
jgi:hypothetical protein